MPKGRDAGAAKTKEWYKVEGKNRFLTPVVYFSVESQYLNEADKIARLLMAVMWSSQFDPRDFMNQNLIGQGTLAVASSGNKLYVAANDCYPSSGTWSDLKKQFTGALAQEDAPFDDIVILENPNGAADRTLHAESQLAGHFHKNTIAPDSGLIGVSKPCCQKCAEMLDRVGLTYSYWHTEVPPSWVDPNVPDGAFAQK